MKIYIWRNGKSKKVLNTINPKECTVLGFIDNAPDKRVRFLRIRQYSLRMKYAATMTIS